MTKIICIGGKAQNGKDTSAEIFLEELNNTNTTISMIFVLNSTNMLGHHLQREADCTMNCLNDTIE